MGYGNLAHIHTLTHTHKYDDHINNIWFSLTQQLLLVFLATQREKLQRKEETPEQQNSQNTGLGFWSILLLF